MAAGAGLPSLSSWTSAPATAASCGSTTLILISAEAMDGKMYNRKKTLANPREQRMHVSFITRKGCVDGSRRSPGFASQDASLRSNELWPCIRLLQSAFPGCHFQTPPVTGCGFLAYSCAAARELHPLPIAPACRRPTIMREPNFEKEQNSSPANLPGTPIQSQLLVERRASREPALSAVEGSSRAAGRGRPALHLLVLYDRELPRSYLRDVLLGEAGDAL